MADIAPPPFPYEPQEIARGHIARHSWDAEDRAILIPDSLFNPATVSLSPVINISHPIRRTSQRTRLIALLVEMHDPPSRLGILRLNRHIPRLGRLAHASQARSQRRGRRSILPDAHLAHAASRRSTLALRLPLLRPVADKIETLDPDPSEPPVPHRDPRPDPVRDLGRGRRPAALPREELLLAKPDYIPTAAVSFAVVVCPPPLRAAIDHSRRVVVVVRSSSSSLSLRRTVVVGTSGPSSPRRARPPRMGRQIVKDGRAGGWHPDVAAAVVAVGVGVGLDVVVAGGRIGRRVELKLQVVIVGRHSPPRMKRREFCC